MQWDGRVRSTACLAASKSTARLSVQITMSTLWPKLLLICVLLATVLLAERYPKGHARRPEFNQRSQRYLDGQDYRCQYPPHDLRRALALCIVCIAFSKCGLWDWSVVRRSDQGQCGRLLCPLQDPLSSGRADAPPHSNRGRW